MIRYFSAACLTTMILTGIGVLASTTASADEISDVMVKRGSSALEETKRLIQENPGDPRQPQLRLHYGRLLMGLAQDDDARRSAMDYLRRLAVDVGVDSVIGFQAQKAVASIYFHGLHNPGEAFATASALENLAVLHTRSLDSDEQRIGLYCDLANYAFALKQWDEVEKYTRLVMAYPHLGMEDRSMYKKFYDHYENAATLYVMAFCGDRAKLKAVEIYPSHGRPSEMRQRCMDEKTVPADDAAALLAVLPVANADDQISAKSPPAAASATQPASAVAHWQAVRAMAKELTAHPLPVALRGAGKLRLTETDNGVKTEPVSPDEFSLKALGMRKGGLVADERDGTRYQFRGEEK